VVLDPFLAPGTTGAMAKKLQRHYIGIEVEEAYVRNARNRLSRFTQLEFNAPIFVTPNPRSLERVPIARWWSRASSSRGRRCSLGWKTT
jgi:hypothetical protein